MTFQPLICSPSAALSTLATAIAQAKGSDPLASVTVVVPTNVAGVMARRALGSDSGILRVDMVTINRLAELLAGPSLAHDKRQPVSTPLLELTVRRVLDEAPGSYGVVAHHPATVVALRELHQELRLAGESGAELLAQSARGREAVRVSRAVTRILQRRWYDEADLLAGATDRLRSEQVPGLDRVVLYLPAPFDALGSEFVRQLSTDRVVHLVTALTGNRTADHEQHRLLEQLGISIREDDTEPVEHRARPARVVSTTDADDEVRVAVRTIIDAARGAVTGDPVPFERIAVLWPTQQPYARLVEHHLNADGIPWNGRSGTELTERIAPRFLLDLLAVDRRGLQRRSLFELLADVPAKGADGLTLPTAEWERVSRRAGVSRDEDWLPRLGALSEHKRWGPPATSLREFIVELRSILGHPQATRTWAEWVDWCDEQLASRLGSNAIAHLSDSEYRAWEALVSALERLKFLDTVAEPVTRSEFRTVLENELADAAVRDGRIGTGVAIGSLASAGGLVIDVAIVLGAAEGLLPPSPRTDPLLSAADRERAGLASADQRAHRLHHEFVSTLGSAHTVVTMPRGDLRSTTVNQASHWIPAEEAGESPDIDEVDSSTLGLQQLPFAPCERERRLRDRLRHVAATGLLTHGDTMVDDITTRRGLALVEARRGETLSEFDGDLSLIDLPTLSVPTGSGFDPRRSISPTQIQQWVSCPHGYFVHYLLGVSPVDEPDSQLSINALDRGSLHHDALDALHRDVLSGVLPQPTDTGWTDEHRQALEAHFDTACADAERLGRTGRPAVWASERERMHRDLFGWFERDSEENRARGITIIGSELRFPDGSDEDAAAVVLALPGDRQLPVRGSIDRLDRRRDGGLIVTDHKTGGVGRYKKLSAADPTLDGTVFQLPTYAAAARAVTEGANDRVLAEYSMFGRGKYERFGIEFDDEVWSVVGEHLGDVIDGIESGWFPQVPQAPGFRMWVDCHYCEPDELGTTDAFERWTAKRSDERIARWFGPDVQDDPDGVTSDD
ncbi:PD-(D/E)XK nuclease family protein [Ilumatobacter nonamiensis]|uniref:PD-(D/E)XK nuclease family protein n=1 Tax=Ilumatobacter nonamiensis TaxID=467093 RepID=UPI00130D81D8|nr:PD-(D/E)XK nuclease family protein [Ilumatobacter nonamiensis]